MKPRVLIVDDEKNIRSTLSMVLGTAGYAVREAESGEEALSALRESPSELVFLDIGLPGQDGMETLKGIKATSERPAVIMISGQGTIALALEATRLGAFDFLEKPLSKDRVLIAARNALQLSTLGNEVARLESRESVRRTMVGDSEVVRALRRQIEKVAPTSATVLITGESGTGKELVARGIHEGSPRAAKPFIKVNCAAIPDELIESELFGAVRGAFTGADRTRDGKFLLADGGTLFLDEVGDMNLKAQAKVLRALQEGEIERVGDSRTIQVDVRVIAATNKNLEAEVGAGRFREDLFFRLNVIPIHVVPLRDRKDDIRHLARHFLALYTLDNDLVPRSLAPGALRALEHLPWRGNIRELENVVDRLAILAEGPEITERDVAEYAFGGAGASPPTTRSAETRPAGEPGVSGEPSTMPGLELIRSLGGLVEARREFERHCIERCLDATGGNVSQAARLLNIERSNLHKKMQFYGLEARPPRPGATPSSTEEEEP
jgi:two-component system nitrogen regulation response regulator NtrX